MTIPKDLSSSLKLVSQAPGPGGASLFESIASQGRIRVDMKGASLSKKIDGIYYLPITFFKLTELFSFEE